jgi:glycosyltransferase involved in cell wall biosynthesis
MIAPTPDEDRIATPRLSVVIAAFEMADQLARTVRSLSPAMQRGVGADDYELIVVDNGSDPPLDLERCDPHGARLRFLRIDGAPPSPAAALNHGIAVARAPLIGAMIDGARLASPRVLELALLASRAHPRPVVCTHGFHLGRDVQQRTAGSGYDEDAEAAMLEGVDWTADGYRLFEVSVPALASRREMSLRRGWFDLPAETNSLFLFREMWEELGGFDERFVTPGGGMVNIDTFARACAAPDAQVFVLLGEGTFHQVHGGVSTNNPNRRFSEFVAEYERLRGDRYRWPRGEPLFLGAPTPAALTVFQRAIQEGTTPSSASSSASAR